MTHPITFPLALCSMIPIQPIIFILLCISSLPSLSSAIHVDEAGINDFVLRTAGHGIVGVIYAHPISLAGQSVGENSGKGDDTVWITSQSNENPAAIWDPLPANAENDGSASVPRPLIGSFTNDSTLMSASACSIAARNVTSGDVLWRSNTCSTSTSNGKLNGRGDISGMAGSENSNNFTPRHATLASNPMKRVFSYDDEGVLRSWNALDGGVLLDVDVFAELAKYGDFSERNELMMNTKEPPRLMAAHFQTDSTYDENSGFVHIVGTILSRTSSDITEDVLQLHHPLNGQIVVESSSKGQLSSTFNGSISAKSILQKAKLGNNRKAGYDRARILDIVSLSKSAETSAPRLAILAAWSGVDENIPDIEGKKTSKVVGSVSYMALAEVELSYKVDDANNSNGVNGAVNEGGSKENKVLHYRIITVSPLRAESSISSTPLILSSLKAISSTSKPNRIAMLAISATTSQLVLLPNVDCTSGKARGITSFEIDVLHPYWRFISSISVEQALLKDANAVDSHVVKVAGVDDRYPTTRRIESLFLLSENAMTNDIELEVTENSRMFQRVYGNEKSDEESMYDALAFCPSMGIVVTSSQEDSTYGATKATSFAVHSEGNKHRIIWSSRQLDGDTSDSILIPPSRGGTSGGLVNNAHLMDCSPTSMTVAFTSRGGMTVAYHMTSDEGQVQWTAEEALSSIASAIFLDETQPTELSEVIGGDAVGTGNADDEEEKALQNLQFSNRIHSQLSSFQDFFFRGGFLSSITSIAFPSEETKVERDFAFGFAKISVMLSEKLHRLVGLDTTNRKKKRNDEKVVWSMNLNSMAKWHKIIHGGQFVSLNDPHGNGGVHDHEMLALSFVSGIPSESEGSYSMEWQCFDGTNGRVFSSDAVKMTSEVVQIVPMRSSLHHSHELKSCRQVALLVHADRSVSVLPDTTRSYAIVNEAASASGINGLFVHTIDSYSGELRTLRVVRKAGSDLHPGTHPYQLLPVGTALFDPSQEKIVNVAYPQRGEVIQSPSTILGDDALLLKYLNPHLVVVVTEATSSFLSDVSPATDGDAETGNGFYNALVGSSDSGKRKPLGATKPGAESPQPTSSTNTHTTPSLFISLVDTASGRILHRVSHSHALESDMEGGTAAVRVPVVVSENWVVYAFFNQRTRRTDVGVLTLHEGMIEKNGLTAFKSPEQEKSFSSLETAKPIVLSKTYGMPKVVTALGVTMTKAGISSKQFLFATGNDQVISIDRRMIDPRRPIGELKDSEKLEGLMRYSPLLPTIPLRTPSHLYEVSSAHSIASTSANVESQSLVLAYGGPDIFFTRIAPSKGFDLLPDDFNRGLLTVVLFGLIVVLKVFQRMNGKKVVTTVWL